MAEAPLDLKWNIDLRLAAHTENVPLELRGRPVASNSLVWTGDPEAGRKYLERALSCATGYCEQQVVSFLSYKPWRILIFRMAGAITPSRVISTTWTTSVLIH